MTQNSAPLDFAILGGDMRQNYLANYLYGQGHRVTCFQTPELPFTDSAVKAAVSLSEALNDQTVIIGPTPFSRDDRTINGDGDQPITFTELYPLLNKNQFLFGGNLSSAVLTACRQRAVNYFDLMKSDALVLINAEITAEGMLGEIIHNTPFVLSNTPVLIIGCGRCGRALAHKLAALNCQVSICEINVERKEGAIASGFSCFPPCRLNSVLSEFAIIINTVPSPVLDRELISRLSSDAVLFDLSSPPGGIDFTAAKARQIPVFHCLGLPGKTAPLSAGEAIGTIILERMSVNV